MERIKYVLRLSTYIKNYQYKLFISILIHGLYKFMPVALGFETAWIVSKAISGNLVHPNLHFFLVLGMVIATAALNYLDIFVSHDVAYRILTELRAVAYEKIAEIAPAGLEGKKSGDMMSIVLEDIEILEWFYAHSIIQIFVAVILPISSLLIMMFFSPILSIVLLFFILLMLYIPYVSKKRSDQEGYEVQSKLGDLNAFIIDGVQGLKETILFRWQKHYFKNLFRYNDAYNDALFTYSKRAVNEIAKIHLIIGISSLVSTILIVLFARSGRYSYEMVLPLISLSTMIYLPLQETLIMSSNYGRIFASAKRVFQFLQMTPNIKDEGLWDYHQVMQEGKKEVAFESVRFHYVKEEEDSEILKGLSMRIKQDETVVLVGSSGCGKSTCTKLLQRFWDVNSGNISINGIDIRNIKLKALRKLITVVPQDVYLFNRSIKENLMLANEKATDQEREDALLQANADEFLKRLKNGIDTFVGEKGVKLSGGEKQRISIAQAFLKKSPILALDEITANLDYYNEKMINEALKKLKEGKMTLMVAHRLSTIKSADRIVFIKDGICQGEGTYEELIESNPAFRKVIGEISV